MVTFTRRFALLAALSSIVALSYPTPIVGATISVGELNPTTALAVRHSAHGHAAESHDGGAVSHDKGGEAHSSTTKHSAKKSGKKAHQRHDKPIVPLPPVIADQGKKSSGSAKDKGTGVESTQSVEQHRFESKEKHSKGTREMWVVDPVMRMRSLLVAGGLSGGNMKLDTSSPQAEKRHHHHPDKVIVNGNHDHVAVHRRSLEPVVSRNTRSDRDRIVVEGQNDRIHVHDGHDHDHHGGPVVVKGDDDHVHVHRSPIPHHHHHHHDHHDHDKVVVKGDNDNVHVHRRRSLHRRRHHRYHHPKVIIKGDDQHVHVGRAPSPAPEPHHHHHHHRPGEVVVQGDHDSVSVHHRRAGDHRSPIVIPGNRGDTYVVAPTRRRKGKTTSPSTTMSSSTTLSVGATVKFRRDDQINGVPGTIEIMSPDVNSTRAQRIASLVIAAPVNVTSDAAAPFVLNASDNDRTQMFLVPAPSTVNSSSPNANSTGSTSNASPNPDVAFRQVTLQMPVFDAESAQLKPYCATFNPRPSAPAPMTVESCMDGAARDAHRSQVFAYEPDTGIIRPMWYEGEDNGTDSGGSAAGASQNGTTTANGTNSSTPIATPAVDPTTPKSDNVASVTSFDQEALDSQYGDATRSPLRDAKAFTVEALENAQNVTLMFAPTTPEVLPHAPNPVGKVAAAPVAIAGGSDSTATDSATSTSDSMTVSVTSVSATTGGASNTGSNTSSASAMDVTGSAPSVTSSGISATSSDAASPTTSGDSGPTPPALEVKVYNPYAIDSSSSLDSASASSASTSTDSGDSTATGASVTMTSTMTPVSTAPYEWMFNHVGSE